MFFLSTSGDNYVVGNSRDVGNAFVRAIQFLLEDILGYAYTKWQSVEFVPAEWRVESTEKALLFVQFDMPVAFLRIDYEEVLFAVELW